jgi:hypothetical protein
MFHLLAKVWRPRSEARVEATDATKTATSQFVKLSAAPPLRNTSWQLMASRRCDEDDGKELHNDTGAVLLYCSGVGGFVFLSFWMKVICEIGLSLSDVD